MFRVSILFNKQLNYELQTLYEEKEMWNNFPQNVNSKKFWPFVSWNTKQRIFLIILICI